MDTGRWLPEKTAALFTGRSALAVLGVMIAFGLALVLENRPGWCKSGIGLWSDAWTHCTSQHFLDPYTPSHVLHGVILYWLLRPLRHRWPLPWRLMAALVLEIGWELLENSPPVIELYRTETASLDYTGDSILNSVSDALASIVGFAFAARFSWKASIALFIVAELWALWVARDNLILNVLMLFWSSEAIKQWQWELARPAG